MITDRDQYINDLKSDIELKRSSGKNTLYKISQDISDEVANYAKQYFESVGYTVETRMCQSCMHNWDVIIHFF